MVSPWFSANGVNWNDYVVRNQPDGLSPGDAECDAAAERYTGCVHGGEVRSVPVPGFTECSPTLTATDLPAGALNWRCVVRSGQAYMVSTGLAQSRSLHDLLDLNPPGFRNMQLRVSNGTTELFTTAPAQWWTQPVELITGGETLSTAGTIYVLAQDASGAVTITADQVGLVVVPSARLTNTESSTNVPTLRADNRSRLWICLLYTSDAADE